MKDKLVMLFRRFLVFGQNVAAKFGKAVKEQSVMLLRRSVLFARNVGRNRENHNKGELPTTFAWPYVMNSFGTMHGPIVWRTWIWNRQHARWHHGYYRTRR